jgi:hypothetical protein
MLVTTGIQKQKNAAGLQNIHELSTMNFFPVDNLSVFDKVH